MFRFSERLSRSRRTDSKRYVKRAGLFAAGLVLLWTALQLFPTTSADPPVYSDEAGSVATSPQVRTSYQGPRIFTLGNLAAFILLVGGTGVAFYMHKRSRTGGGGTSLIESIGELPIGQGQQLRLVRCGGEVLLIGATAQEITLLRDFDPSLFDDLTVDNTAAGDQDTTSEPRYVPSSKRQHVQTSKRQHAPSSTAFADILRQYAGRYVNIQSNGRTC